MFFQEAQPSALRHVGITSLLVFSALLLAIWCPSVNVVFGIIGGTCSAVVCFCFPAAYMLKLLQGSMFQGDKLRALLLLIGAIMIGAVSTGVTLYSDFAA